MRFLCLHGRGTNSDIFESQLASFRSHLSPEHVFDFLDAQFNSLPAPGIGDFFPPPYLCWHHRYSSHDVRAVHQYIVSVLEEDGPYDGIIGFSEGAALAASLLLCEEYSQSRQAGLTSIKIAILFNSVVALSPYEEIGCKIGDAIMADREKYVGLLGGISESGNLLDNNLDRERDELLEFSDIYGLSQDVCTGRISIHTLHVLGESDPFVKYARTVAGLCVPEKTEIFMHDGGHELPRGVVALRTCADAFERTVVMASLDGA